MSRMDPPARADLDALVAAVAETVERLLRKAERLNHAWMVDMLREHAGMWKSKKESAAYIRTADGAAEMAEEMAEVAAMYKKLDESFDAELALADFREKRRIYARDVAQRADDAALPLRARVDAAGSLSPAKRGGLLRSIRHRITSLREEADFCHGFGLMNECRMLEGVIAKYRVLADDLKRGRPVQPL